MFDDGCEHLSIAWPGMVSVTHYVAKLMMLSASLSPHTHTCIPSQYELELTPRRSINLT